MVVNSRQKGARGEREIAKLLTTELGPLLGGAKFSRMGRNGYSAEDIDHPVDWLHIECKRPKTCRHAEAVNASAWFGGRKGVLFGGSTSSLFGIQLDSSSLKLWRNSRREDIGLPFQTYIGPELPQLQLSNYMKQALEGARGRLPVVVVKADRQPAAIFATLENARWLADHMIRIEEEG